MILCFDSLALALLQIPVFRFTQAPGDMVYVNAGTVFWLQVCGFRIAEF